MLRIIYISVQKPGLDRQDFKRLCDQSARNNSELGIKGLLLFNGEEYLQCIEGPKRAVTKLYNKIVQDSRHSDIRLLVSETPNQCLFENWSMMGLAIKLQAEFSELPIVYTLLDHRMSRPWRSLGLGAADLIYEYAKVKAELEKLGETDRLGRAFELYLSEFKQVSE